MAYKKSNPNGQAAMAASEPVVIANNQSAIPVSFTGSTDVATQTTLAAINTKLVSGTDIGDVTINNSTGAAAVNIQDGGNTITVDGTVAVTFTGSTDVATQTTLAAIKAKTDNIPALGQALAASSVPVILPTATITTLTPPAAITGFSTETTLGTVHGHVDSIDTKTPALGQALAAASVPVVLTAAQMTTLTPVSAVTVTNATAANLKAEVTLAAAQTLATLTTITNDVGIKDNGNSITVDNGGTFAVQAKGTTAESGAIADNPINTGGTAVNAPKTVVHNGDAVGFVANLIGQQIMFPYTNPENFKYGNTSDITNTTPTTIIAGTASNYLYVTHILVTNSHATVGTFVNITEETSGTVLYTGYAAALGGGFSVTLPTPLRLPTAGKAIQCTPVTTGSNIRASATGFISTI